MRKVRMHTMLSTPHSWALTMRSLAESFYNNGWAIDLRSSNGIGDIPGFFHDFLTKTPGPADIDVCYTLPKNLRRRFHKESSLKAVIFNYESNITPPEWAKESMSADLILPSSNFCKDIFIKNGWGTDRCRVVPLGISPELFLDKRVCALNTKKKFKFLNVSIPHHRKNIPLLVDAYYNAFTDADDVCLVIKTNLSKPRFRFECDVKSEIISVQKKYGDRNLPQIEIITKRFNSLVPLYNACDVVVSATSSEGFGLPLLEGMASGKIVLAPNCTGQSDFMNNENSIHVDYKKISAGVKYQYWKAQPKAETFLPLKDSLSEKMAHLYRNYDRELLRLAPGMKKTSSIFTWDNSMNIISSFV
jgi:glycosyltransferase involved in cell wall biosynthesis